MMDLQAWESYFESAIREVAKGDDPAHDILHFKRVVATAKHIGHLENAKLEVVVPAAWLHDFVIVPKDSPLRSQASRLSSEKAIQYLKTVEYPQKYYNEISHAIEAHSFSANVPANTIEAKVVQDADRLDGLGAIGIARCFATAGVLKRPFYSDEDPFCTGRNPEDSLYTLDHFYKKLFKTAETLKTNVGRKEGQRRIQIMKDYIAALKLEI